MMSLEAAAQDAFALANATTPATPPTRLAPTDRRKLGKLQGSISTGVNQRFAYSVKT
jgi:hypothetical protein